MTAVNDIRFNQDQDSFIASLDEGIRIYNVEPLYEMFYLDSSICGSVAFAEMVFRTNIIALVSGGKEPLFTENVVAMWDECRKMFIFEFVLNLPILDIHVTRERLLVILQNQITIYDYTCNLPVLIHVIDIADNFKGLSAIHIPKQLKDDINDEIVRHQQSHLLLAYPGSKIGTVHISDLNQLNVDKSFPSNILMAHENPLYCMSFNFNGTMLATTSKKGTIIRIFDVSLLFSHKNQHNSSTNQTKISTGTRHPLSPKKSPMLLYELRRGTDSALFYCINFSQDSRYVCTASDKGTIHVFALSPNDQKNSAFQSQSPVFHAKNLPHPSKISDPIRLTLIAGDAAAQTGITHFPVTPDKLCVCAFSSSSAENNSNKVYAISADGTYQKYIFTPDGGNTNCNREIFENYLDLAQYPEI